MNQQLKYLLNNTSSLGRPLADQGGYEDLLLPGRRKLLGALVVTCQPVDTALDQNQTKLGILVLAVPLQMFAHGHSLLDQVV